MRKALKLEKVQKKLSECFDSMDTHESLISESEQIMNRLRKKVTRLQRKEIKLQR